MSATGYAIPRLAPDVEWSLPFSPFRASTPRRHRAAPSPSFSKGERLELPSRNVVELLRSMATGELRWECGYVVNGVVMREGHSWRNRLTLREDWLLKHGRPAR